MKIIGVLLIVLGCVCVGILRSNSYRREEAALQQLGEHLQYMICQLRYQQTPLPELFFQLQCEAKPPLQDFYSLVCKELQLRTSADASACLIRAVEASENLPSQAKNCLLLLSGSLGRFDLDGQLNGAEAVYERCMTKYVHMEKNRATYIRSYMIFGLCAGAAIAVLLL